MIAPPQATWADLGLAFGLIGGIPVALAVILAAALWAAGRES